MGSPGQVILLCRGTGPTGNANFAPRWWLQISAMGPSWEWMPSAGGGTGWILPKGKCCLSPPREQRPESCHDRRRLPERLGGEGGCDGCGPRRGRPAKAGFPGRDRKCMHHARGARHEYS